MGRKKISNFYESLPYIIWIILTITLVLAVEGNLVISIIGGLVIMITMLVVIPYSVSSAMKLGILGSPCKWGLHQLDTVGYNLECRRCGKRTLDNN